MNQDAVLRKETIAYRPSITLQIFLAVLPFCPIFALALSPDEAQEQLRILSSSNATPQTATTAAELLRSNPEASHPILVTCFVSSSNPTNLRAGCCQLIRESAHPISRKFLTGVLGLLENETEPDIVRLYAGFLLLKQEEGPTQQQLSKIFALLKLFIRNNRETANARNLLALNFPTNKDVDQFLITELQNGHELDPTLLVVGRRHVKASVPVIVRMVHKWRPRAGFEKTRAYLALGEIGGKQAFEALMQFFQEETDPIEHRVILRAIGLSRDPRAVDFLTNHIKHGPPEDFIASLDGLGFLGDKSVVPLLQKELARRPITAYRKQRIAATMANIDAGGTRPYW